jgi:hypothetical protein
LNKRRPACGTMSDIGWRVSRVHVRKFRVQSTCDRPESPRAIDQPPARGSVNHIRKN